MEVTGSPSSHPDCSPEKGETLSESQDRRSLSQETVAPVAAEIVAAAFASASALAPVHVRRAAYSSATGITRQIALAKKSRAG
jgi:ferric-dicitrate binding protein FerR (iron transport regulator)